MFVAHVACYCLGGAAIDRARFPAVPRTKAAFVLRIGAAAADKTLAICAVFSAQTACSRLGGAAINRARFPAVVRAEPSGVDVVGAALHRAHSWHSLMSHSRSCNVALDHVVRDDESNSWVVCRDRTGRTGRHQAQRRQVSGRVVFNAFLKKPG